MAINKKWTSKKGRQISFKSDIWGQLKPTKEDDRYGRGAVILKHKIVKIYALDPLQLTVSVLSALYLVAVPCLQAVLSAESIIFLYNFIQNSV